MISRPRAFAQVDVFTSVPTKGNPVAVVLEGEGLSDAEMQAFAHWTNLSETTFVLPPTEAGADYRVRIFTPQSELPFAGHPTLGTVYALIEAGHIKPKDGVVVQQSAVGLVPIRIDAAQPELRFFTLPDHAVRAAGEPDRLQVTLPNCPLLAPPAFVHVGPEWIIGECDAAALMALTPDYPALADYERAHKVTGLTLYAVTGPDSIMVRSFAPSDGITEDPVCGSGNGAVAAYRLFNGQIDPTSTYTARQGQKTRRDGTVHVRLTDGRIDIGGACVTLISGTLTL